MPICDGIVPCKKIWNYFPLLSPDYISALGWQHLFFGGGNEYHGENKKITHWGCPTPPTPSQSCFLHDVSQKPSLSL